MKKVSKLIVTGALMLMCMSSTFLAASESFSATLLPLQMDNEVSVIKKETNRDYCTVTITSIQAGVSKVCVWTEDSLTGRNYSSPYKQIGCEISIIPYSPQPSVGTNVALNIDNPVYTVNTYLVKGGWTPN